MYNLTKFSVAIALQKIVQIHFLDSRDLLDSSDARAAAKTADKKSIISLKIE